MKDFMGWAITTWIVILSIFFQVRERKISSNVQLALNLNHWEIFTCLMCFGSILHFNKRLFLTYSVVWISAFELWQTFQLLHSKKDSI